MKRKISTLKKKKEDVNTLHIEPRQSSARAFILPFTPDAKSFFPVFDLRINTLIARYREKYGTTGVIFHDQAGNQLNNINGAAIPEHDPVKDIQFYNIEFLWKTEWTVIDHHRIVPYEESPFLTALRTGKTQKRLFQVLMKNGEYRWLFFHSQPFQAGNDKGDNCIATNIVDVTNQKKLVEKSEKKEWLLDSLMKKVPSLYWIINEEGMLVYANTAFYSYFGLKERASVGKKLVDMLPVSIGNKYYKKHQEVFNTGQTKQSTDRYELADGTCFEAHVVIFPLDNSLGGKLVAGQSFQVQNTSREEFARTTSKKFLLLNHAISEAIWEWDMQSGNIYRNEPLMRMIGYNSEHVSGLSWWLRHIHSEDRGRIVNKVKQVAARNEHSWQEQYRFQCADGHYIHIQDRGYVVYENGLAIRMIGSLTDISQVKQLEDELTSEKIRRHREVAETVIRVQEMERTRFAHELHDNVNQILSSAKLFVELIKPVDEKDREIRSKGAEYISLAIEEIRKLSKELVVPQLKQNGLTTSIQTLINDLHLSTAIHFSFEHDSEKKFEFISPDMKVTLFRIVQEQIKNILKYSKASNSGISLRIKSGNIELIIWDDGVGFNPHQTQSGIGLSNIRERVSFYNGHFELQSAVQQGCRISVSLPLD